MSRTAITRVAVTTQTGNTISLFWPLFVDRVALVIDRRLEQVKAPT
jgi:hypothetical protein